MKTVLTIAGSDCSGGAGIQADIKTITAHKLYAMSVITALTAQNTTGIYGMMEVTPEFLTKQMECIWSDIVPDAIKIGMVSSSELISTIADKLRAVKAKNIVVDPVMVSTSGSRLLAEDATKALIEKLLPIATVITPNIPEAEVLSGIGIECEADMVKAAKLIAKAFPCAILIKGGHSTKDANDLLYTEETEKWFYGKRIATTNTHGTGCTLSSAIASNLALGYNLTESIGNAKEYLSGALKANLNLGIGSGPLDHTFALHEFG